MADKKINDVVVTREIETSKNEKKEPGKVSRFFSKIGKKFKETFSELKKVSWPTFEKTVKNTGIVIVVVIIFLVIITAFDYGFGQLVQLITK